MANQRVIETQHNKERALLPGFVELAPSLCFAFHLVQSSCRIFWGRIVGGYHYRVSTTRFSSLNIVTPHRQYLRHSLCGANHYRVPPARCSLRSLHTAVKSTIPLAASTATEVQHGAAPQLLTPYDPPLGFIWFTITASFLRCGVGVFSSFSKVNIQFLRMFCVSVPVLLV